MLCLDTGYEAHTCNCNVCCKLAIGLLQEISNLKKKLYKCDRRCLFCSIKLICNRLKLYLVRFLSQAKNVTTPAHL